MNENAVEIIETPTGIIIRQIISEAHNQRFEAARKKGNKKYAKALRELAKL